MDNSTRKLNKKTWDNAKSIFTHAIALPFPEVEKYLSKVCKKNEQLLQLLTEMVEVHHSSQQKTISPEHPLRELMLTRKEILEDTVLGKFRIIKLIEKGGMGDVYLAERDDELVQQKVAIKAVPVEQLDDSSLKRFELERRVLASLEHPNIARLIDVGESNGYLYCVMEFVDGMTITEYCRQHRLNVNDRLRLFLDVCEAVHYAHINLIVHRDLKPNNILVTKEGVVKLLDFGIAKPLHQLPGSDAFNQTIEGANVMTPQYAAPEQFSNQSISTACDIYTLGLLLYELMTENSPYDLIEKSWGQIERIVTEEIPINPSKMVLRSPPNSGHFGIFDTNSLSKILKGDVDSIVMHALKKLPQERYSSSLEFSQDINHHLYDLPISVKNSEKLYRFKKYCKRNWLILSGSVIILAILSISSFMVFEQSAIAKQERDVAIKEKEIAEQTTQFLIDVFTAADTTKHLGVIPSVDGILQEGVDRLNRAQLTDEIRNRLKATIGEVYWNMGRSDDAQALLDQVNIKVESVRNLDQVNFYLLQAHILLDKGGQDRLVQAINVLRKAELIPHTDSGLKVEILLLLAEMYSKVDAVEDVSEYLKKASFVAEKELNKKSEAYAHYLRGSANLALNYKRDSQKLAVLKKAADLFKQTLEPEDINVAHTLKDIAAYYAFNSDKPRLALQYLMESKSIYLSLYNKNHPEIHKFLNNLATVYIKLEEYDKAIAIYQDGIYFETNSIVSSPSKIGQFEFNMARVYSEHLKDYPEAIVHFENAMNAFSLDQNVNNDSLLWVKTHYALTQSYKQQDIKNSEVILREAINSGDFPAQFPGYARLEEALAVLLLNQERYAESKIYFSSALESYKKTNRSEKTQLMSEYIEKIDKEVWRKKSNTRQDHL